MKNVCLFDFIHSSPHLILFFFLCLVDHAVLFFFLRLPILTPPTLYIHIIHIYRFAVFVILDLWSFQIVRTSRKERTHERKKERISQYFVCFLFFVHAFFFKKRRNAFEKENRPKEIDMMEHPCWIALISSRYRHIDFYLTSGNSQTCRGRNEQLLLSPHFSSSRIRYVKQLACRFHPEAVLVEDYRAGDMVCPECGLVVGDRYERNSLLRQWSSALVLQNDRCRFRVANVQQRQRIERHESSRWSWESTLRWRHARDIHVSRHWRGCRWWVRQTEIQQRTSTSNSKQGSFKTWRPIFALQMSSADRALRSGYDCVRQMAGRINLSNRIISRAFTLFKQCYENKCVRGRSQDGIVATCIYIACRQEGAQRTIKGKERRNSNERKRCRSRSSWVEICAISTSTSKKEIGRIFKQIVKSLPSSSRPDSIDIKNLVVSDWPRCRERWCTAFFLLSVLASFLQSIGISTGDCHSKGGYSCRWTCQGTVWHSKSCTGFYCRCSNLHGLCRSWREEADER